MSRVAHMALQAWGWRWKEREEGGGVGREEKETKLCERP